MYRSIDTPFPGPEPYQFQPCTAHNYIPCQSLTSSLKSSALSVLRSWRRAPGLLDISFQVDPVLFHCSSGSSVNIRLYGLVLAKFQIWAFSILHLSCLKLVVRVALLRRNIASTISRVSLFRRIRIGRTLAGRTLAARTKRSEVGSEGFKDLRVMMDEVLASRHANTDDTHGSFNDTVESDLVHLHQCFKHHDAYAVNIVGSRSHVPSLLTFDLSR